MRRLLVPGVLLASAMVATILPVAAQDLSHPADISAGDCSSLGAVVAPLGDVSSDFDVEGTPGAGLLPVGADPSAPIAASITTVDLPLSAIVSADHSVVVRASTTDATSVLACGAAGGRTLGDAELPIALVPVNGSGLSGIAVLTDTGSGTTRVAVYVVQGGTSQPVASVSPGSSASPGASATLVPTSVVLDQPLQFAGYDIQVKEAVMDPVLGTVIVDATFTNTGTGAKDLTAFQLSAKPALVWGQDSVPLKVVTLALVPPGTTSPLSFTNSGALPDGFTLDDAVLTLGTPGQHPASLPLRAGATGTYLATQAFTVPKAARSLRVRGELRVTIEAARLMPATCGGGPTSVAFDPIDAPEMSIVLTVTVQGSRPTGSILGSYVTVPDGTSSVGGPGTVAIYRGDTLRDVTLCYRVPAPGDGRYTWRIEAGDRKATAKFTIPAPEAP